MNFSWKETESLTVTFLSGDQMRLTFATCTSLMMGRFEAAERERFQYLATKHGDNWRDEHGKGNDADTEILHLLYRSIFLSALTKVEGKEGGDETFQAIDLPAEWKAIDSFIDNVPQEVYQEAVALAVSLNPGRFYGLGESVEKNGVKFSVKRLTH